MEVVVEFCRWESGCRRQVRAAVQREKEKVEAGLLQGSLQTCHIIIAGLSSGSSRRGKSGICQIFWFTALLHALGFIMDASGRFASVFTRFSPRRQIILIFFYAPVFPSKCPESAPA
jgi:hypothetical protein